MNMPNKLTLLRILLSPLFLAALVIEFPFHYFVALVLFGLASITDFIDGRLARKNNIVTDFGKFLDPLADKMLTTAAFLGFIHLNVGYGILWITFIVLIREFLITSLRLVSAGKGNVISANFWGKAKTVSQMIAIIITLLGQHAMGTVNMFTEEYRLLFTNVIDLSTNVSLWISTALTVLSGIIYLVKNRKYINPDK